MSNKGLDHLKSLLGKQIGDGECYSATAEYAGFMGACHLGAGTKYTPLTDVIGTDTVSASDIGITYDWAKYNWKVIKNPAKNQLVVGAIINWARGGNVGGWNASPQYGHTGIIRGLDNGKIQTYEQNTEKGRVVGELERDYYTAKDIASIVIPPDSQTGGGNGNNGGGENGNNGTGKGAVAEMIKVNSFNKPLKKTVRIGRGGERLSEEKKGKHGKYQVLREILSGILEKRYPEVIKYINSLQGGWGLEKLCCAPFTTLTLTNGKGAQKNVSLAEFRNQNEAFKISIKGYLGKSNRIEFFFEDYLIHTEGDEKDVLEAIIRKDSVTDCTPRNFELLVSAEDSYNYLNENQIKQSLDNAAFAQSQNKINLDNSSRNFSLRQSNAREMSDMSHTAARQQLDITHDRQWANFGMNQIGNVVQAFGGAATGNVGVAASSMGSMLVSEISTGINQHFDNASLSAAQANQAAMLVASQGNEEEIFKNSLKTSQLIASNNYENTIANINAGLADIKNQPDITAVSGSDYNFELGYDNDSIYLITYITHPAALVAVAEFFARFGYSINRYAKIEEFLRVRESFNYVKTKGANIQGKISNKWRNNLNLIFDNGITLWRNHEKMARNDITENY